MPPPARPSSGAASDALQAAVRALGTLSGQDSQDDQALEQSLHLPFLLPPARPPPAPAATAPARRRARQPAFSVASSSTAPVPTAPAVIKRRRVIDEDEFPHVYSPLSDGGFTLGDCWNLHGRDHCPETTSELPSTHALDAYATATDTDFIPIPTSTTDLPTTTATAPIPSSDDNEFDMNSLPKGWAPKAGRSELYPIPAIVICSFFLAFGIVGIIVVCAFIRRRRKAKIRAADVEGEHAAREKPDASARLADVPDPDDDYDEIMVQKNAKKSGVTSGVSVSGAVREGKLRWRGRLVPSALRTRRSKKRRDQAPASPAPESSNNPSIRRTAGVAVSDAGNPNAVETSSTAALSRASSLRPRSRSRSRRSSDTTSAAAATVDGTANHSNPTQPVEATTSSESSTQARRAPPTHISASASASSSGTGTENHRHSEDDNEPSDAPLDVDLGDDEDAFPPAYARRRSSPSYTSPPPPPPHSSSVRVRGRSGRPHGHEPHNEDDEDTDADGWGRIELEGHVATDDKASLARLAQMRSEPQLEVPPPPLAPSQSVSLSLSHHPSGVRGTGSEPASSTSISAPKRSLGMVDTSNSASTSTSMHARGTYPSRTAPRARAPSLLVPSVPDEETLVLHESSIILNTDMDFDLSELEAEAGRHGPRVDGRGSPGTTNSVGMSGGVGGLTGAAATIPLSSAGPSSSLAAQGFALGEHNITATAGRRTDKSASDTLPAHIHRTTRHPQPRDDDVDDEDDEVPEYELPPPPPLVLPLPVVHEATAREYARLAAEQSRSSTRSATPVPMPSYVARADEAEDEAGAPSAPPALDKGDDVDVQPSAPPLDDDFDPNHDDPAVLAGASAPPAWD